MNKEKLIELLEESVKGFEKRNLLVIQDMQPILDTLGINKKLKIGDNVISTLGAIHLKILQELLKQS